MSELPNRPLVHLISADSQGPFLIGNLLNYGLMGILVIQVYFYRLAFPRDRTAVKALVYLVFILDVIQTGLSTHQLWTSLDNLILNRTEGPAWSIMTIHFLAGLIAFIVQSFFAWRIWILGIHHWARIPIVALIIFAGLVSCIMSFYKAIAIYKPRAIPPAMQTGSLVAWLATGVISDLLITVTLVIQLRMRQDKTFRFVKGVLHRTVRMAIETGALTCSLAITELVLYFRSPVAGNYLGMLIVITGKIYSNSLLASLNSRAPMFRKDMPSEEEVWRVEDGSVTFRRTLTVSASQGERSTHEHDDS